MHYNCSQEIQMNSARQKVHKNAAALHTPAAQQSRPALVKAEGSRTPAASPSYLRSTARQDESMLLTRERSNSIKSKSSFKLFLGRSQSKSTGKQQKMESQKENVNPNVARPNPFKGANDKKGRTVKEVRLAVSKLTAQPAKPTIKPSEPESKKLSSSALRETQSILKYTPNAMPQDFKRVSVEDFIILRSLQQLPASSEFLVLHKRLNCVFALRKFEKSQVVELELAGQLTEAIKIHLFLTQRGLHSLQQLFVVFDDATFLYLLLEPLPAEANHHSPPTENIRNYCKLVESLSQIHSLGVVLRNISTRSVRSCMGVLKLTDLTCAGTFSVRRRRQSFLGCLEEAPHEVATGREYDSSYDMWSLGVLFYESLVGLAPFRGEYAMTLIKNLDYGLPVSLPGELAALISSLLCERERRVSAAQCLRWSGFWEAEGGLVGREIFGFWAAQ